MDITERAKKLKDQLGSYHLDKSAEVKIPKSVLFPKLDGPAKPPNFTPPSQPELNINEPGLATLPKMRRKGFKPLFTSELKKNSPYNLR